MNPTTYTLNKEEKETEVTFRCSVAPLIPAYLMTWPSVKGPGSGRPARHWSWDVPARTASKAPKKAILISHCSQHQMPRVSVQQAGCAERSSSRTSHGKCHMDVLWKNPSLCNSGKKCSLINNICKACQLWLNDGRVFRSVTQTEKS